MYPEDLSGGQKQRAVLARALITDPDLVVADEPVAALDMSVRAKVLDLLMQLREELDLTCLYITHDLASGKFVCDRLAIMYLGRFVEWGASDPIYASPQHPYTRALLDALPQPDPSPQGPREVAAARRDPRRGRTAVRAARSTPAARRRSTRAAGRAATWSTPSRPGGRRSTSRPSSPSRSWSATSRRRRWSTRTRDQLQNQTYCWKVAAGEYDAAFLAAAGILRLGLEHEVTEWLSPETMLPAPGQGALAVQCRADDDALLARLVELDDRRNPCGDDSRTRLPPHPRSGSRRSGRGSRDDDDDPSCSSPGTRRIRRWRSDGPGPGRGRAAELGEQLAQDALAAGADRILAAIRG